jgi:hypothetical protein
MKIWNGYGTEHSANLVIVGSFKTIDDATKAKNLIEELTQIVLDDEKQGLVVAGEPCKEFSPRIMEFVKRTNFTTMNYSDPEQLLYNYDLEQSGTKLNLHTEEQGFQLFLNVMIHCGAKIEMFSAHDYPSKYSRH